MSAISVTISGDSPAEVATRLHALADALARPSAPSLATTGDSGGLPAVPSSPAPRLCSVHATPLTLDSWTSKAGKACKAWRCPQSTASTDCDIEWAS
ncbi:MAG: hypothetical protein ACR2FP_07710 [Nocardioidaceae bacterium]